MIYLITQLAWPLLLVFAGMAVAGWAWAGLKEEPRALALQRERERLVKDILKFGGEGEPDDTAAREIEALRGRLQLEGARAAAAERALETARGHAEEVTGRLAALERAVSGPETEREPQRAINVEATPVASEEANLQSWRLRYYEQRVRFLEGGAKPASPPAENNQATEWRARVAEARAAHLEEELRDVQRAPPAPAALLDAPEPTPAPDVSAFAADVETDALLRWRMLYLERRVAHLQANASAPAPAREEGPDAEQWKWRARYLEGRLRYLERRQAPEPTPEAPAPLPVVEAPAAAIPTERPPTLPGARGGAPDDFTLIEGVSAMQQSTLNSLGVFHFDQIAAWTPAHVAWVDRYLRLRGRIGEEEWVEQADALARGGVAATRRALAEEDA